MLKIDREKFWPAGCTPQGAGATSGEPPGPFEDGELVSEHHVKVDPLASAGLLGYLENVAPAPSRAVKSDVDDEVERDLLEETEPHHM